MRAQSARRFEARKERQISGETGRPTGPFANLSTTTTLVAAWTWALLPRLSLIGRLSRVPHPSWVVDCTLTLVLSKVLYCSVAYVQCGVVVGVVAVSAC